MTKLKKDNEQDASASVAIREAHENLSHGERDHLSEIPSAGVGPLQVGKSTAPGDLDVHVEYIVDEARTMRAIGVRVRASKVALILLIIGGLLAYALIANDRELIKDGLHALRSVASEGTDGSAR